MQYKIKSNGTVAILEFDELLEWYSGLALEEAEKISEHINEVLKKVEDKPYVTGASRANSKMYQVINWSSYPPSNSKEAKWPKQREANTQLLKILQTYYQQGESLNCDLWVEGELAFIYMGAQTKGFIFPTPEKWFSFQEKPDYSEMSPAEMKRLIGNGGEESEAALMLSGDALTLTPAQVTTDLKAREQEMEDLHKTMEEVKRAQVGELAELQAKIRAMERDLQAKKEAMMAELNAKMDELEAKKDQLETQIFLLDSQIYAIRCYTGEVMNFVKIREGKDAPIAEPIVVHQKLRFLDEELGKLASLYTIQWEKIGLFEEFLRHSPIALDTFAPNERCVVLVRLSRTGKEVGANYQEGYANMLVDYEYFHGETVGIIIRNGENLYLGWTDESRVKIDDDLVNNVIQTEVPEPRDGFIFESDKKRYKSQVKDARQKAMQDVVSRLFVYNILQGIADNGDILPLPKGVRYDQPNEYVKFAVADMWLDDGRFGSFNEIVDRCNEKVSEGDILLTVQHLVAGEYTDFSSHRYGDRSWENPRGRGDKNRTHDCKVEDCHLYKANVVEFDTPINMTKYRYLSAAPDLDDAEQNLESLWQYREIPTEQFGRLTPNDTRETIGTYDFQKRHVYVSVSKEANWRRKEVYERQPRANFELYEEEYINLTYMNSVWLEWVITQKKLGGWCVGGKDVDYAYAIKYLKTAMDFIRDREKGEKTLIDAVDPTVCRDPEWPLKLSEWKLEKGVHYSIFIYYTHDRPP